MVNDVRYLWIFILIHGLAWALSVYLSIRSGGIRKSVRFFVPVMLAGFALEASGVLSGKYGYPDYPLQLILGGRGLPLIIMLGWSNIVFYFRRLARSLAGSTDSLFKIPLLTALLGILYDVIQDPIAFKLGWWYWPVVEGEAALWNVPVTNFSLWFVFLFFITLFLDWIEKRAWPEKRKLIVSIVGLPVAGLMMLAAQMVFRLVLRLIGWL